MRPERWQQIEKLYHPALKQEVNRRTAFLKEACAGDEDLRHEVESLLAQQPQAESIVEGSALVVTAQTEAETRARSMVGRQLGAYKILSLLGAGGMGEVYRAKDTRLDRTVAIKVLPGHLSERTDLRQRFEREARALASLSHPHICPIHVIGKEDGIDFLVMEYVAGKTLDELIPRKGLRFNEVLKYAIQIADALATAHAAGIVHRDLKPGNIMVSESGQVKVLDFGLAKLSGKAASQEPDAATLLASGKGPRTEEGTVLGTVSYMSPEQAEGKNLDARSDIFSFGLVLYEMVTGQKAFTGESNLAILTAILRQEPKSASQIIHDVPPDLEKIIKRCLRKDRERRSQTMADVKIALQELKEESDSGTLVQAASTKGVRRRGRVWAVVAVVALAVAGVAVWINRSTTKVPEAPLTAVPLTSYPGEEQQASFSPDGNQVAFSWNGEKQDNFDIYIKDVGSGAQRRLTTALEGDFCPAWSPDGRSIAFFRGTPGGKVSVYSVSPLGPPERKVAEIGYWFWHGIPPPWTPDAKSLVVSDRNSENEPLGLFLLSIESGERRRLTSSGQEKQFGDIEPALSPDGRTLAFVRELNWGLGDIYLLTLSEDFQAIGESKRLTFENRRTGNPVWTSDGRELIFSFTSGSFSSPSLFRIAASGSGKPQRLAGVGEDGFEPAISRRTERLVYSRELTDVNIWRVEVPGPQGKASSPMKLVFSTRFDGEAQFSPDGRKIVFASNRSGSDEIWVCNSDGSSAQQLTSLSGTGNCGDPRWSLDGERISFDFNVDGKWATYVISANGGKPKRFLPRSPVNEGLARWSRDGKWIYFDSVRSGESQIWKAPAEGGEAVQVTRKGGSQALESADGNWVYYEKDDEASSLWKVPKDGGEETQVLESVATRAFAVVKEGIYFIPGPDSAGRSAIQFFSFATKKIRSITTIERPVGYYLSVSPDGRWILYSQIDQSGRDLMLVENFR